MTFVSLVYHVMASWRMADCCLVEWLSKVSCFSMKITDEFISKFKFISVQLVCDVIYSVSVLELLDILSLFQISYYKV
jgi:hypothetical protein